MPIQKATKGVVCLGYYIPRWVEAANEFGSKIIVHGKQGQEKEIPVRLKHRPDLRIYISKLQDKDGNYLAWSTGRYGEGYITHPFYVNPQKGHSGVALGIEVLWEMFDPVALHNITGHLNSSPIKDYKGIEKHIPEGECLFRVNGCTGNKCSCVWRPYQVITWMKDGKEWKGVICGSKISLTDFCAKVKARMNPKQWELFRDKKCKKYQDDINAANKVADVEKRERLLDKVAAMKLLDNFKTLQRTDFSGMNCYGLTLHQAGLCVETGYLTEDEPYICLVLNKRDPEVETARKAHSRFAVVEKEDKEVALKPEKKKEEKKPKTNTTKSVVKSTTKDVPEIIEEIAEIEEDEEIEEELEFEKEVEEIEDIYGDDDVEYDFSED